MSTETRIAELESKVALAQAEIAITRTELAAAQAELAALKAPKAARVAPPPEEGVRITTFPTAAHLKHLPDAAEAAALLKIVTARFPSLQFRNATGELESFRAAFAYICSLTKTSAPTTKYAASWWVDAGQQWTRENGVQGIVRGLLPAIIATADAQFCLESNSTYWLDPYRSSGRLVDPSAWRQLLNGGDLIVPTKITPFMDNSIGLQRVQTVW
jgi:hypothetical protein